MQECCGAFGMRGGCKDGALVVFQNLEPVRNVTGVIGTRFRRETKIGGKKRAAQLGDKFFGGVTFIAPAFATEFAVETGCVASSVRLMPISA